MMTHQGGRGKVVEVGCIQEGRADLINAVITDLLTW